MGVHAGHRILQARRARLAPQLEQWLPRLAAGLVVSPARVEIQTGEDAVESLHERAVLERAARDSGADPLGDVQVHAVELRDAVAGRHAACEAVHLLDHLGDGGGLPRWWVQRIQRSTAVQGRGRPGDDRRGTVEPLTDGGHHVAEDAHHGSYSTSVTRIRMYGWSPVVRRHKGVSSSGYAHAAEHAVVTDRCGPGYG